MPGMGAFLAHFILYGEEFEPGNCLQFFMKCIKSTLSVIMYMRVDQRKLYMD